MLAILCADVSIFAFRFRGRASLEIELIALAASHRCVGIGQAGNRCPMASQRLAVLLAVAITASGPTQNRSRNP